MLTPQEVSEHTFAKAGFGGYNMAMVDEFLDQLTADYTALYKENAVLKSKMKVLVDKVEEYRSTEDAMRKALLSAQRMADEMVSEAEHRKEELLQNAESEARAKLAAIRQEVESEQFRLTTAQNATTAYVAKLKELYQHEMDYLNGLSKLTAPAAPAPDRKETIAQEIEASLEKKLDQELGEDEEDTREMEPIGAAAQAEPEGGLYDDLRRHREPEDEREAARAYEESEAEEVTSETRRIPSKEDLMDGLGYGRHRG